MVYIENHKIADLLIRHQNILPVYHRFGFQLGMGNITIRQLCEENEVLPDFFLAIINTYINENYFPEETLLSFSPLLIINYLRKTHEYYANYSLPKIEELLIELIKSYHENQHHTERLLTFYQNFEKHLLEHIQQEEKEVFPFIESLFLRSTNNKATQTEMNFEEDHHTVDSEIKDLKSLLIRYIPAGYNPERCNELLAEIFRFEKDLSDHARIEDLILIPKVKQIQAKR